MITTKSEATPMLTMFSNGASSARADAAPPKGSGQGFRPHELLEAALATCINMTVRLVAGQHGMALTEVRTRVELDRSDPEATVFRYDVELDGELSERERLLLRKAAALCPVKKTLSKPVSFACGDE